MSNKIRGGGSAPVGGGGGVSGGARTPQQLDVSEYGDIFSVDEGPVPVKALPFLLPGEEAASFPEQADQTTEGLRHLNLALGPRLTFANPVWNNDSLPYMRMLQRKLIETALTFPEDERKELMEAISTIENSVKLRMRWHQMRRSDTEENLDAASPTPADAPDAQAAA